MTIESLELTNFRSYGQKRFKLHPAVTLVVGPNASGKTNLLESLYVLASTKSFRAKDRDLIRHEQDFFRVVAETDVTRFAFSYSRDSGVQEKRVTHDEVRQTLTSHIGRIQVTLFEPTDLDLLTGSPEGRRKYLDFILCQTDRGYLKTLQSYRRVLRQRNALLDGSQPGPLRDQMFAWDVKFAELALEIFFRRSRLVEQLNASLPRLYADIAGSPVEIELEYLPSVPGAHYGEVFLDTLVRNLPRDLGAGFTTIGPHREDFKIRFKGGDIMAIASRGETRTAVLACKLAELEYAEAATGVRPVLLLDDVFSELDHDRRSYLLGRLDGYQTIITTTDADAVTREIHTPHQIISTSSGADHD